MTPFATNRSGLSTKSGKMALPPNQSTRILWLWRSPRRHPTPSMPAASLKKPGIFRSTAGLPMILVRQVFQVLAAMAIESNAAVARPIRLAPVFQGGASQESPPRMRVSFNWAGVHPAHRLALRASGLLLFCFYALANSTLTTSPNPAANRSHLDQPGRHTVGWT
jgi:hypothetical protein